MNVFRASIVIPLFSFFLVLPSLSEADIITGSVFNQDIVDYTNVKIVFDQYTPVSQSTTIHCDATGHYSIDLQPGGYNITYSAEGYFNYVLSNQNVQSSQALPVVILVKATTQITVPAMFSTIQAAVNAARSADTVLVSPGKYIERIKFRGKSVVVGSLYLTTGDTAHISNTVIDGNAVGRIIEFSSGEDSTAVLCGFSITNGNTQATYPDYIGGTILCNNASPTLRNLHVYNNRGSSGPVIVFKNSSAHLKDSFVYGNLSTIGGVIYFEKSEAKVTNTVIHGNFITDTVMYINAGKPIITNTIINGTHSVGSLVDYHSAVYFMDAASPVFRNCIISNNPGWAFYRESGVPVIQNSAFSDNNKGNFHNLGQLFGNNVKVNANGDSCDASGNIFFDPQYVDPVNGDFHLRDTSPCIGAGTADGGVITDVLGMPRGMPPDMGAYENPRIIPLPYLRLIEPNSASVWVTGATHSIIWSSLKVSQVKLDYSTDGGATWNVIASSVSGSTGRYDWKVTASPSLNILVRITDVYNWSVSQTSDGLFRVIKGGLAESSWPMYRGGSLHTGEWGTKVSALNQIKWKTQAGDMVNSSPVIGADGTIFFGSNDSYIYAVNQDGTLKWKYKTGGSVFSSAAIGCDGAVYIGSRDKYLYALNPEGTLRWKFQADGQINSSPVTDAKGIVYVGSNDTYLYAVNPDGTLKWKYKTGNTVESSPAIGFDGTIYVGSKDTYLYAINPNGTLKWNYQTGGPVSSSPAIGTDGTLYIGSFDTYLYAVNPNSTLKWKYKTGNIVYSSPAIGSDGTIYVGSFDYYLYAVKSDGTLKWKYQTGKEINSSPSISGDGTVFIGSDDGYLYALNSSGSLRWKFMTGMGSAFYSSPAIAADGTIYTGSGNYWLYAFEIASITLTSPNGGEKFAVGSIQTISWKSTGASLVKLEYSTDNGVNWAVISGAVSATLGNYAWTVPGTVSTNCRIRVTNSSYPTVVDQSDGPFSIGATDITVVSPNGGEQWPTGRIRPIIWSCGGIAAVKIEYSRDGGVNWETIIASTPAAEQRYLWTVPDSIGVNYIVRVTDTENSTRTDQSDAAFRIIPPPVLRLTAPNGGEGWRCLEKKNITWTAERVWLIRIDYSPDGGNTWLNVADNVDAATDSLSWTLPDETSSNYLVRITDRSDTTFFDTSDAPFSIQWSNLNAGVSIDTDLRTKGNQEMGSVDNIGPGKLVGFALYAEKWENAKGFSITFSWDSGKLEFRPTASSSEIADNEITINGETFTLPIEPNILGGSLLGAGEKNLPGFYTKSFAITGGTASTASEGLVYFAVFRTKPSFAAGDTLAVRAAVQMADERANVRDLAVQFFTIRTVLLPPTNVEVADVPNDNGHQLRLAWTASSSEQTGMVYGYRIYRSRSDTFTTPIPLSGFASLDSLLFYEAYSPILIDSVGVGETEFIDPFVPLDGIPYFYWVQTMGSAAASKPAPSSRATAVEETAQSPLEFRLGEAYPNPFNPRTVIEYYLPVESQAILEIYTVSGQRAATLLNSRKSAGKHAVIWDARGFPSGLYFYTLKAGGCIQTRKVTLLK
jgi:outer membrane protein assembly factor BamB